MPTIRTDAHKLRVVRVGTSYIKPKRYNKLQKHKIFLRPPKQYRTKTRYYITINTGKYFLIKKNVILSEKIIYENDNMVISQIPFI